MNDGERSDGSANAPGESLQAGAVLTDASELLHRQIHSKWVKDGHPTSLAFRPSKKDNGKLSVARGALATAKAAHEHHTRTLGLDSCGTWSVSVSEVDATGRCAQSDPITTEPEDPAHAIVDFSGLTNNQQELTAKRLKHAAISRGRQHPAVADASSSNEPKVG